jgi:hypothetical protein
MKERESQSPQPMLRSPGNEIRLWRYIRYVGRRLGVNPIHDFSQQEKGFGTMSAFIDASTRLSLIVARPIIFRFQTSPASQSGR